MAVATRERNETGFAWKPGGQPRYSAFLTPDGRRWDLFVGELDAIPDNSLYYTTVDAEGLVKLMGEAHIFFPKPPDGKL